MAAMPSTYLPCDYYNKQEIYHNLYLVDGRYYYIKVETNVGGSPWCSLVYLVGVV